VSSDDTPSHPQQNDQPNQYHLFVKSLAINIAGPGGIGPEIVDEALARGNEPACVFSHVPRGIRCGEISADAR